MLTVHIRFFSASQKKKNQDSTIAEIMTFAVAEVVTVAGEKERKTVLK